MVNLFCEHWELFSETWPTSGSMRNGQVFERPTPGRHTTGSEYLSSRIALFDTPDTMPEMPNSGSNRKSQVAGLGNQALSLLRTPTAAEVEGGPVSPAVAKAKGQTLRLTGQVLEFADWGQFATAIQRWETVTARIAPEPTLRDGQKGQHRLSSKFTEWMMGLPEGWITGQGLHRKDEIKMAGNGVVPQQAKYALKILLDRVAPHW